MSHRPKGIGDEVVSLLRRGDSYNQIAVALDCSTATVAYHAKKHGLTRGGMKATPRVDVDWSEVQRYYDLGNSVKVCGKRFGFSSGSWGTAVKYGDIKPRAPLRRKPLGDYLVENTTLTSNTKKYLIESRGGFCEECKLTEWLGKRLSLDIHHINENNRDNRPHNLRVLCPNCHRQQGALG